jgi:cell division protein FtsB
MLINENRKLRKQNIQLKEKIKEIKDKLPLLCEKCKKNFEKIFSSNKEYIFYIYKEP